jgi:hypothetical protein
VREVAYVVWTDSSLQNGQVDERELPEPENIASVGWVVKSDETHIVLAREDMNNGDWRGLIAIPRECVRSQDVFRSANNHCSPLARPEDAS